MLLKIFIGVAAILLIFGAAVMCACCMLTSKISKEESAKELYERDGK